MRLGGREVAGRSEWAAHSRPARKSSATFGLSHSAFALGGEAGRWHRFDAALTQKRWVRDGRWCVMRLERGDVSTCACAARRHAGLR